MGNPIMNKRNVVGLGRGKKWVNGKPTNIDAIIVFVEKKLPTKTGFHKLSADDVLPTHINNMPIDVIEVGHIVKQLYADKVRPLRPGYSTGHVSATAGTIGGFFIDRDDDIVGLSNNHILAAENKAKINELIWQPGPKDATFPLKFSNWQNPDKLGYYGTLKKYVKLIKNNNLHDSAIVKIHESFINNNMIDFLYPTNDLPIMGFGPATPNMDVQKWGRTTEHTIGKIISLHATFTISYDIGPIRFKDCIVTTNMSDGGDSGSIIFDMKMNAVGLLFAGSNKVTLANPIKYPVDAYGLKIIPSARHLSKWKTISSEHSRINNHNNTFKIISRANAFCYLEQELVNFRCIEVDVNTGTDKGTIWGPCVVIQWPDNFVKISLQYNKTFGGFTKYTSNTSIGLVKENTQYTIRISKDQNFIIGEILCNGEWYKVLQIPTSTMHNSPLCVRIGKSDTTGSNSNSRKLGEKGFCLFSNFNIR